MEIYKALSSRYQKKSTKVTSKFQINPSGYDDMLFQITSENNMLEKLKW